MGAAFAAQGTAAVKGDGLIEKVLVPGVVAPILALVVAALAIFVSYEVVGRLRPGPVNRGYRLGQIASAGLFSLAHGTNDAQKTMGIITLALIAHGDLPSTGFDVPLWVIVSSAAAIALGTYTGGWRIIRTMGSRIIKMDPAQGFAAQSSGAAVILTASHLGFPLSTTHVISGAVMGAGAAKRLSAVRWGLAGNIAVAWVLTLPAAAVDRGPRLRVELGVRRRRGRAAPHHAGDGRRDRRDLRPPPAGAARARRGMIAAVDIGKLVELVWVAPLAAVAVALCFSLVIVGATKAGDCRRADRPRVATAYGALSVLATALCLGGVLFAISVIATK